MPDAAAFHQVKHLFRQILGVITGSFKSLRDKQKVGVVLTAPSIRVLQVTVEYSSASLVDA
jgi:hypothetical protein